MKRYSIDKLQGIAFCTKDDTGDEDERPHAFIYSWSSEIAPQPEPFERRTFIVRFKENGDYRYYCAWVREMSDDTIKAVLAHIESVVPDEIELIRE